MKNSLIKIPQTNEWLGFISRLGLVSIEEARKVFLSGDYSQLTDLGQKALYTAGRGKTLSLEGNLIGSKLTLDEAQSLAETRNAENGFPAKDEVLAYVLYERGVFFEKFGEVFNGLSLFRSAKRLLETKSLELIVDYQLSALQLDNETGGSVQKSLNWIHFFEQNDMQVMQLIAMRRLAKYHRQKEAYQEADSLLTRGIDFGIVFNYPYIVEQFKNSYGYLMFSTGQNQEARDIFLQLLGGLENKYLKPTVLENLTLTHCRDIEYDAAIEYLIEAIDHSQKYDILSRIPDECLFIGDLYREKLHQPDLATHYYNIGAQVSLDMAEHGFSLKGERLNVVQRLENRPKVGYSLPDKFSPRPEPFAFAIGKTWKEINDLFQFHLIRNHLESGNNISDLPGKLGLKASTYYAIKRRLNQHGYDFEGDNISKSLHSLRKRDLIALRAYVNSCTELTWSQANQRFEKGIIEYLFKQVGYQKTKLAEKLDVSYPTVLQKTKSLKRL
ncbi:hypothetical protein HQ531_07315 [bacterium]|nr:hypothetical protein [bacterium]